MHSHSEQIAPTKPGAHSHSPVDKHLPPLRQAKDPLMLQPN